MTRLLLTHGYFLNEDVKEQAIMRPYSPLGLLYLSSHLRDQGFEPEIYDSTFGSRAELYAALETGAPGVVGIYGNLMTRGNVLDIVAHARAAGWRVLLGGPEPANYAAEYLDAGADLIVAGEGELAMERLVRSDFVPEAWASIDGLVFRASDGEVVRNRPAALIADLDAQPWPDRGRIDMKQYLGTWRRHHGSGSVSLITARGCPYSCNWCSHSVYGKTHRRRSPAAVAAEVEHILEQYSPEMLWIADDVFTIHHGWIANYAAELKRRGIRVPFECITRADRLNEHIAATLAELGCMRVWIGSESGSQRVLDAMERGVTVEQVYRAVTLCKAEGIQTGMFLMWGYEGEDLEDIEATVAHVNRCRPDIFLTTVSYPIRGTTYYRKTAERQVAAGSWDTTTDREIRIRGRHSRRFYAYADQLLKSATSEGAGGERACAARLGLQESYHEVEA